MHVGRCPVTRDRLERGETDRTNAFLAAFAEDAHGLSVKIDSRNIESGQFAQTQAATVKKLHDRDIAQRHPNGRGPVFYHARGCSKQFLNLLARENKRQFFVDLRQLELAHGITSQTFSLGKKPVERA